jgi:hypothetical protein
MNWLKWTMQILMSLPSVVMGIESMVQGAKQGPSKKDLALAALGLSSQTAANVLPEHQEAVAAATSLASNAIDNFVALANAARHPAFTPAPMPTPIATMPTPAPVETPAPVAPVAAATVTAASTATEQPEVQPGPGLQHVVPA